MESRNNKTVYTLTFVDTTNYGALLQAYALQKYLLNKGYDTELIRYRNPKRKFSQVSGWRKLRSIVWHYTFASFLNDKKREKAATAFVEKRLRTTDTITTILGLEALNNTAMAFTVGSDQVWNPMNNANDPAFLLSFVKQGIKKLSYAASFGRDNIEHKYLFDNRKLFEQFDKISIRERSGQEVLKEVIGIESELVPDPVFLLPKSSWEELLVDIENSHNRVPYVFCYELPGYPVVSDQIFRVASEIASAKSIQIRAVGRKKYAKRRMNEESLKGVSPEEFLSLLCHADAVVTNSFHGTALSVIFQKDFFTVLDKKLGSAKNTRLNSMLDICGLSDRVIYTDEDAKEHTQKKSSVDYVSVDQRIEQYRLIGDKYIDECFEN